MLEGVVRPREEAPCRRRASPRRSSPPQPTSPRRSRTSTRPKSSTPATTTTNSPPRPHRRSPKTSLPLVVLSSGVSVPTSPAAAAATARAVPAGSSPGGPYGARRRRRRPDGYLRAHAAQNLQAIPTGYGRRRIRCEEAPSYVPDVVVIGRICIDIYPEQIGVGLLRSGPSASRSAAARRTSPSPSPTGNPARLITRTGDDPFGRLRPRRAGPARGRHRGHHLGAGNAVGADILRNLSSRRLPALHLPNPTAPDMYVDGSTSPSPDCQRPDLLGDCHGAVAGTQPCRASQGVGNARATAEHRPGLGLPSHVLG